MSEEIKKEVDKTSCWYENECANEMNRFYDQYIKGHDIAVHMSVFTQLLALTDEKGSDLIDLGTGTAMISEFCKEYKYFGSDLPHIISGCAMRNYPQYLYKSCDICADDLSWIDPYKIVVVNGVIDIMEHALDMLDKVLKSATKYVLVHRQEITEAGTTHTIKNGSYSGWTFHSVISRADFNAVLEKNNFEVVKELHCSFGNWENGGSSFLLRKRVSWALDFMDHKIHSLFFHEKKERGFFIEAGANDGLRQSNTMYFERYKDWRGILIEPVPLAATQCKINRSENTIVVGGALVSPEYVGETIDLYDTYDCNSLMSVVKNHHTAQYRLKQEGSGKYKTISVPAFTLNAILDKYADLIPPVIDLLALDVETYELEVLKGIDFDKWNIRYILCEELDDATTPVRDYLRPWYHANIKLSGKDILFERK